MNPIQAIVIVGLAAVWIWVLGRPVLQNLFDRSRRDPVGHFTREMSVLGAPARQRSGRSVGLGSNGPSLSRRNAQKRRLQIFLGLGIATVVSLFCAVFFGGIFVVQNVVIDVLLVAYVVMAARAGAAQHERGAKVTRLNVENIPNPVYARAANGR